MGWLVFAALRRYEAAGWLRKMVEVVGAGAKDLPAQPTEDEFRIGLRSGIILCNVLNKIQSGAVPKVGFYCFLIIKTCSCFFLLCNLLLSLLEEFNLLFVFR